MKVFQKSDIIIYEWPCQPSFDNETQDSTNMSRKEKTQEKMISSLQAVFCKGYYRSWVFSQGKRTA